MSDWTVHLAFDEGTSSKFWRARVEGKTLYVNYGKIGSNGQTQVKDLGDPAAAQAEYDKLVREKRKKGYHDAGDASTVADAAEDAEDADDAPPAKKPAVKAAISAAPAKPAPKSPPPPPPPSGGPTVRDHRTHLLLDTGSRKVATALHVDGNTLHMASNETYATPEAAKKAFERLKKMLGGEGYKDS